MDDQDYKPRNYQDDLDNAQEKVDPVIHELTDDPAEGFGVPAEEFGQELDRQDPDGAGRSVYEDGEDMREEVEGDHEKRGLE